MKVNIVWLRRDLRLRDNAALIASCEDGLPVLLLFIFDKKILGELPSDDSRVTFIYRQVRGIHEKLGLSGSSVLVRYGDPYDVWDRLTGELDIGRVFINRDYEPYAIDRDLKISRLLAQRSIRLESFKDQVVFEGGEIHKLDGKPYTVYTPYKNRWLEQFVRLPAVIRSEPDPSVFFKAAFHFPSLGELGFKEGSLSVIPYDLGKIKHYDKMRDLPYEDSTTLTGPHLRYGTISIRELAVIAAREDAVYLSELIWREFFMQILYHFPQVVTQNFKKQYDNIQWRNDPADFERWCTARTGYPLVDAGMTQLNQTGYMHNRVRMVVASFLCKHLLIHWSWGEAYFAQKLLDYELSSNNGNWQWAAGTGCDAAPYFRVFNPTSQMEKFDPDQRYIKRWLPGFDPKHPFKPMVNHQMARERAISTYKTAFLQP